MNYFTELKRFWHKRRLCPLRAPAADLYFAILECMNTAFWRHDTKIPNSTLAGMTGRSVSEIIRIRKTLVDAGYIEYKSHGTGNAGEYRLCGAPPSEDDAVDQAVDQTVGKTVGKTIANAVAKNANIYKPRNNIKYNKYVNENATAQQYERKKRNPNDGLYPRSYDIEEMEKALL